MAPLYEGRQGAFCLWGLVIPPSWAAGGEPGLVLVNDIVALTLPLFNLPMLALLTAALASEHEQTASGEDAGGEDADAGDDAEAEGGGGGGCCAFVGLAGAWAVLSAGSTAAIACWYGLSAAVLSPAFLGQLIVGGRMLVASRARRQRR